MERLFVPPTGFEPVIFWMRTRRPRPLDDGGNDGIVPENLQGEQPVPEPRMTGIPPFKLDKPQISAIIFFVTSKDFVTKLSGHQKVFFFLEVKNYIEQQFVTSPELTFV